MTALEGNGYTGVPQSPFPIDELPIETHQALYHIPPKIDTERDIAAPSSSSQENDVGTAQYKLRALSISNGIDPSIEPGGDLSYPPNLYKPLNEEKSDIRILKILPGLDDAIVRCSLQQLSCLTGYPSYTALSYCWGDPTDTLPITIDGCTVLVTRNLEAALKALRSNNVKSLWVDALCINQANKEERGHQVRHMAAIYENAVRTIAWLGPDNGGFAERAFAQFCVLATQEPKADFDAAITDLAGGKTKWRSTEGWSAVRELMALPYWKRTWIIQEVALSRDVTFWWGQTSITLTMLEKGMYTLQARKQKSGFEDGYRNMQSLLQVYRALRRKSPSDLSWVLCHTCQSLASDPRDKIFAVLGLCSDGSRLIPSPDYRKEIDTILREMTTNRLRLGQTSSNVRPMDLICIDFTTLPKRLDIPSWVTDWPRLWAGSESVKMMASSLERGLDSGYRACGNSTASPSFSDDGKTLIVQGFVFDTIRSLSPRLLRNGKRVYREESESLTYVNPEESTWTHENVYGQESNLREAIWRTFVGDRFGIGFRDKAPTSYSHFFRSLYCKELDHLIRVKYIDSQISLETIGSFPIAGRPVKSWGSAEAYEESESDSSSGNDEADLREFIISLNFIVLLQRMMTTQKGYVGLAHNQTEIGDEICLLKGCSLPMILRKCENGHRLVGEVYVHGIMDGEFWETQDAESMQIFQIK